jgi:hypothetical protein
MIEISPTRIFYDGWMNYELVDHEQIHYSLNVSPTEIRTLKSDEFKRYRHEAVEKSFNPAIMLSGGIDSQLLVYSFVEAGFDISPIILDYEGLNECDVLQALEFCKQLKVKPTVVKHPIRWLLSRQCVTMGLKYGMRSPQFVSHATACDKLFTEGYTGAIFGGNAPYFSDGEWVYGSTAAQLLDLAVYSQVSMFPIIGSFCSWTWQQGLSLAALSNEVGDMSQRYASKVASYQSYGVPILPQDKKYTGFEEVKLEIDNAEGVPGFFELQYRVPLYTKTPNQDKMFWKLEELQRKALDDLRAAFRS